jgi:hypothetical protein
MLSSNHDLAATYHYYITTYYLTTRKPTMKPYIITTKPSIYEKLADYVLAFGLGVAIAFGLFVYFS